MKENVTTFLKYLLSKGNRVMDGITAELSENKAILNWIYAAAYLALIFYCAINNSGSHNTAIMTTGGIVGTIFSAYVMSSSYEKVAKMRIDSAVEEPPAENEHGASD